MSIPIQDHPPELFLDLLNFNREVVEEFLLFHGGVLLPSHPKAKLTPQGGSSLDEGLGVRGVGIVVGVVLEPDGHQVSRHPVELCQGSGLALQDTLGVILILFIVLVLGVFGILVRVITFGPGTKKNL